MRYFIQASDGRYLRPSPERGLLMKPLPGNRRQIFAEVEDWFTEDAGRAASWTTRSDAQAEISRHAFAGRPVAGWRIVPEGAGAMNPIRRRYLVAGI